MKASNLIAVLALAATACGGSKTTADGGTGGSGSSGAGNSGGSSGGSSGSSSHGDGGSSLGKPCVLNLLTTQPSHSGDPCAAGGLACSPPYTGSSNSAATGSCELPGEYDACLTAVGCAPPFSCIDGDTIFGSGTGDLCVQSCNATPDCVNAFEGCIEASKTQMICNWTFCGPTLPKGAPANGSAYYAPCNAQGVGDGTCVPSGDFTGLAITGICEQNGTAPRAGPCDVNRDDAGLASQCPFGSYCVVGSSGSLCAPTCAAVGYPGEFDGGTLAAGDAGPLDAGVAADAGAAFSGQCAGASSCVQSDVGFFVLDDLGTCLADCTPGGSSCPSPLTCQPAGDAGVCGPF